jgi:hypothetical protein
MPKMLASTIQKSTHPPDRPHTPHPHGQETTTRTPA